MGWMEGQAYNSRSVCVEIRRAPVFRALVGKWIGWAIEICPI